MLTFIPWYPKYSHFFLYLQINGIQQLFLKLSRAMSSFVVPAKKTLTGNSLQLSTSIVLVPTQTMTILLSAIASKTCPCITGFVSVPIRWQALGAWRLDLLHSFKIQLGGAEEWPASTCTSPSPSFFVLSPSPTTSPIWLFHFSYHFPSSASSLLSRLCRISGLLLRQCPFFLWDRLSFSLVPTPTPFLPPSVSLIDSLCKGLQVALAGWVSN